MHSIIQEKLVAYLSIVFRNHIKNYLHLTYDVLPGGQAIAEVDVKIGMERSLYYNISLKINGKYLSTKCLKI